MRRLLVLLALAACATSEPSWTRYSPTILELKNGTGDHVIVYLLRDLGGTSNPWAVIDLLAEEQFRLAVPEPFVHRRPGGIPAVGASIRNLNDGSVGLVRLAEGLEVVPGGTSQRVLTKTFQPPLPQQQGSPS